MTGDFMIIFDVVCVLIGIGLLINPNWAYNVGRKEKKEVPKNWSIVGRLFGAAFVIFCGFFLYSSLIK